MCCKEALQTLRASATNERAMDTSIRIYASHKEMKAEEYRYWQSRPVHERMDAVAEISLAAYATKGAPADVPRLQGPVVCLQRSRR
jgi:hypothetical protein